jgi:hypothetical protein
MKQKGRRVRFLNVAYVVFWGFESGTLNVF